ncbi:carbamoyl-phosphate synthase large subunit [Candidatus Vidania fulgoroideorum]
MIKKILIIGSGAIIIGQACEFDYSGVQACKSFKEENIKVVLINNNPATVMTDIKRNYKTYIEPISYKYIKKIIKKENIKYIYPYVGGQTALNLSLKINKKNNKIKILGTSIDSILISESRKKFRKLMKKIKIPIAYSYISNNIKNSIKIREIIINKTKKNEVSIRPSYTLGGSGGGLSKNLKSFKEICIKGLYMSKNKEIVIEESLNGFYEYEFEIIVDKKNFLNICCIENFDKVGVHTGDSICFSPPQNLTNKDFQSLRSSSKKIIKKIGIKKCGANIQFAFKYGKYKVIEVNPRLSRSSALASKATGYPIAKISSKLSIGKNIFDIKNDIINNISSAFEPCLDYIVTKLPKFSCEKFSKRNISLLGNQMKSIGESMSISDNLESSINKCITSLNNDLKIFIFNTFNKYNIFKKIFYPNTNRIYNIYELLSLGYKIKNLFKISNLNSFYLNKIKKIISLNNILKKYIKIDKELFIKLKSNYITDFEIAKRKDITFLKILKYRKKNKILPSYKMVDNCSAEYKTNSNYFYEIYNGKNEIKKNISKSILIIGSGPNNIGQGIEFDYCCVHASYIIRKNNFNSFILNCNPETVSTDYDNSDYLIFSSINFESIFNIYIVKKIFSILIQFCGQLSKNIINYIKKTNLNVFGTSIKSIKISENRKLFSKLLKKKNINQPKNIIIKNKNEILKKIKFPIIIRPSYVLGGKGMKIIKNSIDFKLFKKYFKKSKFPILFDNFINKGFEFDVDGFCSKKKFYIFPIIQHIERAGVHSGDSASYIKTRFKKNIIKKILKITKKVINKIKILGMFNIQYIYKKKKIYIIELNPRASRTIPFLMKSNNINYIEHAIMGILGKKIYYKKRKNKFFFFKESIFSFIKFEKFDPILGPEMLSTGEIISYGKNIKQAYIKSQISAYNIKKINKIFVLSKKKIKFIKKEKNIYSNLVYGKIKKIKKIDFSINNIYYISNISIYKNIRIKVKNKNLPLYTSLESFKMFLNSYKNISKKIFSLNEIYKSF